MSAQTSSDVKMCTSCFNRSPYFVNVLLKHLTAVRKSPMKNKCRFIDFQRCFFLFFLRSCRVWKNPPKKPNKHRAAEPVALINASFQKADTDKFNITAWKQVFRGLREKLKSLTSWCRRWTNGKHPRTQQQLIKINWLPINYRWEATWPTLKCL